MRKFIFSERQAFISLFTLKSNFVCKSFAPLRSADARALATQVRAFFIHVLSLWTVKRGKRRKVLSCHRHARKRRKGTYQRARRCYLPLPRQRYVCLLSKSVRFAVCPYPYSIFLCVYSALIFSAARSVHSQAPCKRGSAHHIRAGCRGRGVGVAFRATIERERFDCRRFIVSCGTCTASRKYQNRKHVRARTLSRFASQSAHVRAFNLYCMPSAYIFFRAFKRPESKAFRPVESRASKRYATLRALDSRP